MKEKKSTRNVSLWRLALKTILLLLVVNFGFILIRDVPIGKLSLYNTILKGRERLPFGENPSESYNLSLYNLDAMIASHEINAAGNAEDEYRVFVIGDSSVWGFLQKPEDTLAGILDQKGLICNQKPVRVYNFGYPSLSILKDLMIIDQIKAYEPDLIIWMATLESLPLSKQLETPLVENNPDMINPLIEKYGLNDLGPIPTQALYYSLFSRRRELADILRLQLYGVMWSATGIDQEYPLEFNPAQRDFEEDDVQFYDFHPVELDENRLSFNVITQTAALNEDIGFVVINEPVLISRGENSDVRYNYYYPRWAYDQYREIMREKMDESGIEYYDFWNIIPEEDFTNSAIHLNLDGEKMLAENVASILIEGCQE